MKGHGKRYFDKSLRGGPGIGSRFLLVIDGMADSTTKDAARELAGLFGEVVELRSVLHTGITLVRPDAYVAYSADTANVKALESVRSVLGRQTRPASSGAPSERAA